LSEHEEKRCHARRKRRVAIDGNRPGRGEQERRAMLDRLAVQLAKIYGVALAY
jgi:hypothetical protein